MIEAPLYSAAGARQKAAFALPGDLFDGTVHEPVLHQAVKTYLGNQRQGTAMTKTRSFVSGGNQKPWRQKGTGRARQGTTRAPHWRGGGIVFGPIPRDYRAGLPRKVRQLARRSAFNARAREEAVFVVEAMEFAAPKTSQLAGLLQKMGLEGKKVLVLSNGLNPNLVLSGRNIPSVEVMRFADASAYDVIWADSVVVEQGALSGEAPVVTGAAAGGPVAAKARKPGAVKKPAARTAKKDAARTAKKAAARPKAERKPAKARKAPARKPAAKKKKGSD
ncbi:MAG: 50S ribosomal protein L4 [Gemmatimonadetes bacterium]|nr:MAG: 50S ribosomal protein L4 [Gemmatimonadota bacterium]